MVMKTGVSKFLGNRSLHRAYEDRSSKIFKH